MTLKKFVPILIGFATVSVSLAADSSQWSNLDALKPGQHIGVIQTDQKRVEGRFDSYSDAGIVLRGDQSITIPKDKVVRIYKQGWSRTKRAILGAAIGAGAGVGLDIALGTRFNNEGANFPRGVVTGLSAGIGAGIGAATGNGYKTIYQRTKLP
ncbi:MAG: hypothetical protein ABI823_15775 [Bryobacteraceae bacterium]